VLDTRGYEVRPERKWTIHMKTILLVLITASMCFAQDTTKDERKANRERVKAEQQLLTQQDKEGKNRTPEPENSIASILQRHPIQDVPVIQNADPAKLYDIKGDRLGMTLEEYGKAHYSFFPAIANLRCYLLSALIAKITTTHFRF
jgi:hypothetical protein